MFFFLFFFRFFNPKVGVTPEVTTSSDPLSSWGDDVIARSASYVRGCRQTDVSVLSSVRKIIDFFGLYMNPGHVLQSIGTLQTWFLQNPRKVKLRLKAGLFGDPVLTLFFEKRCKNVAIVIIVSPAWKWPSSECRNCDVSTTYSSCLLMKWQCRRFAHPCPAGICLV